MKKQNEKKVEKVIELNGKFYCVYFGMICERIEMKNSIQHIEVMDYEVGEENYETLERELN